MKKIWKKMVQNVKDTFRKSKAFVDNKAENFNIDKAVTAFEPRFRRLLLALGLIVIAGMLVYEVAGINFWRFVSVLTVILIILIMLSPKTQKSLVRWCRGLGVVVILVTVSELYAPSVVRSVETKIGLWNTTVANSIDTLATKFVNDGQNLQNKDRAATEEISRKYMQKNIDCEDLDAKQAYMDTARMVREAYYKRWPGAKPIWPDTKISFSSASSVNEDVPEEAPEDAVSKLNDEIASAVTGYSARTLRVGIKDSFYLDPGQATELIRTQAIHVRVDAKLDLKWRYDLGAGQNIHIDPRTKKDSDIIPAQDGSTEFKVVNDGNVRQKFVITTSDNIL